MIRKFSIIIFIFISMPVILFSNNKYRLRLTSAVSFPISSYASSYLDPGFGGGIGFVIKKSFWPLHMQFAANYISYSLENKQDQFFSIIPITIGVFYKLPFKKLKKMNIYLFAESGLAIELLHSDSANNYNTAFTAGLGTRLMFNLSRIMELGLSIQYAMLSEKNETASFMHLQFLIDFKL